MNLKAVWRGLLLGILAAMFSISAVPVHATDFSGYVEAPWGTSCYWDFSRTETIMWHPIQGGAAYRQINHEYIENVGEFTLTDAILLWKFLWVEYCDEEGNSHNITDPAEIQQILRIQNSDEMWQGGHVLWLGTIKPGHSRMLTINWWWAYGYLARVDVNVWYLP